MEYVGWIMKVCVVCVETHMTNSVHSLQCEVILCPDLAHSPCWYRNKTITPLKDTISLCPLTFLEMSNRWFAVIPVSGAFKWSPAAVSSWPPNIMDPALGTARVLERWGPLNNLGHYQDFRFAQCYLQRAKSCAYLRRPTRSHTHRKKD